MATVTSNPRRRLSKIPTGDSSYSNIASRYASTFQKAIDTAEENDLQTKLNLFKLGSLKYEDFKNYLSDKIKGLDAGSTKASTYTSLMVEAEKYNKTLIENNAKTTVEQARANMLEQFKGKVTTQNELDIVRKLKDLAPKGTSTYADLVTEEAKLKNQVISEGAAAGKTTIKNNLDKYFAYVATENKQLIQDFQNGKITGYQLDQQLLQNGTQMKTALSTAESKGIDIPQTYYTDVAENTDYVKNRLAQREVGQVFDVLDRSGKVQSITHQELENDKLKSTPDYIRSKYTIESNPTGSIFYVVDSTTGQKAVKTPFVSTTDANRAIKQLDETNGYSLVVPQTNANGITTTKQFNYNPVDQSFSPSDNTNFKLYTPAATGFESRFQVQSGKTLTDFINGGLTRLKQFLSPTDNSVDVNSLQNSFGSTDKTQTGPFMSPTILSAGATQPTVATTEPTVTEPTVKKENFFSKAVDFLKGKPAPTVTTPQDNIPVAKGNIDLSGTNFGPNLNLKSLNLNLPTAVGANSSFVSPTMPSLSVNSNNSVTSGPSMGPSTSTNTGLLDKVKNFGTTALGNIKKFFGF